MNIKEYTICDQVIGVLEKHSGDIIVQKDGFAILASILKHGETSPLPHGRERHGWGGGRKEGRNTGWRKGEGREGAGLTPRILKRWHKGPTMCTNHIRKGLLLRIHKAVYKGGGGQEKGTWGHSLWRRAGGGNLGHTLYHYVYVTLTSPYSPLTLPHLS